MISTIAAPWRPIDEPPVSSLSPHHSVSVLGIIDDPVLNFSGDEPYVDVVAYWPALQKWTVTHQCRADEDAIDYPVRVAGWQPLPEIFPLRHIMKIV